MYSKKDYLSHLLKVDVSHLSHYQIVDLFEICWRYDSQKVALYFYSNHLTHADLNKRLIDLTIQSLLYSVKYHEIKLFFIIEHFDFYDI